MDQKVKEAFVGFMDNEKPKYSFKAITIWLPCDYKEKYDALQILSKKQLSKTLRDLIIAGIDEADSILK